MKSFVRLLALLAFALSLTFSIVATWTNAHLYDEAGFVESSASISRNEQVRASIINVTSVQLAAKANLGANATATISSITSQILTDATERPEFETAWRTSMKRSHQLHFGKNPPSNLTVDVAPFVDLAIDNSGLLRTFNVKAPETLEVQVADINITRFVDWLTLAEQFRVLAYVLALGSAFVALLATPQRRKGSTLALLGAIAVAVTLLLAWTGREAATRLIEATLERNRDLAGAIRPIGQMAVDNLDALLMPVAAVALATAAAGILWRAISARQR